MNTQVTRDFGMIGLGVMGRNFLLNVADHKFQVIGYDLDVHKVQALQEEKSGDHVEATADLSDFLTALKVPRRIMLLVPAGQAVDAVIDSLLPHLERGDIVIDGGNSHFEDTERRMQNLEERDLKFLGMGVSGGEKGARYGPSLMPGGEVEAYEPLKKILEAAAAKVEGEACVAFLGRGAAGHYVKMVHNGIEYGIMQLLAEIYDVLRRIGGLSDDELHKTFADWNEGGLQSFLVKITADIFQQPDDQKDGEMLINSILDSAKQKGTGKWTSQSAMDLGVSIPTVDAAVTMRYLSSLKIERTEAEKKIAGPNVVVRGDKELLKKQAEHALHFAMLVTYAQGFAMLRQASETMDFGLNLSEVAKIWRGGCIIRARMLEDFRQAFDRQPDLPNLLVDSNITGKLIEDAQSLRSLLVQCIESGVPTAALSASLNYFDSYRTGRLPSNLIQAQRDYFGAHTYERLDQSGSFHTRWGVS
jgi:6-phosphogluconate dehydrogenase